MGKKKATAKNYHQIINKTKIEIFLKFKKNWKRNYAKN